MDITIDGLNISSEEDFHREFAETLGIQDSYGYNLDGLWDLLSASIERPVTLVWKSHGFSKNKMGDDFLKIVEILENVKLQDEGFGWIDRFSYRLD